MAENSQWKFPPLTDEMKNWIIDARAMGTPFEEITHHCRDMFPEYATDIPKDVFPQLFTYRLKRILNSSQSSAKFFLEAKQNGEIPINVEAVPLVIPHIRLLCYQQLWDETSPRTLQRVVKTADGEEKVYKDNTRERMAILAAFRKELEILGILKPRDKSNPLSEDDDEVVEIIEGGGNLWSDPDTE